VSIGVKFFGGGALLLLLFLAVGFALPGTWEVRRSHLVAAAPEAVFPHLDSPARWESWVPWPEVGARFDGPPEGVGASRSWDDPEWGDGTFTLTVVEPHRTVEYSVVVEEGRMRTDGRLLLTPRDGGTLVEWSERGDFGWNPLMGWVARFMDRLQGRELERSLARLEGVVTGSTPPGVTAEAPEEEP
jgi:hypothetical protein